MSATRASSFAASDSVATSVSSSPSSCASSNRSCASRRSLSSAVSVVTTLSSDFFSRPSAWAFFESFQTFGSSSCLLTSARRSDLTS
ncbi:peptide chain release factor 2 [Burkholderia pseudomallei]|nr:peptide chain release factor 2 domain protein [Burkholderia pseudomallei]KGD25731.1 peptide chain release factor 2, programmed domain protein [Burkholderia pseudomallei]KGD43929.1 peptide chain release factor 2 [Burkholderia pseudomallei]KGD51891.1 peptide chain release factor 2, programmed domain protein [Burkholderia pseudomallei]